MGSPIDRPQQPLSIADRAVTFRPAFAWDAEHNRSTPPSATASAGAIEAEIVAKLGDLGLPLPQAGAVRDRILHVLEHIPREQQQDLVAVVKETAPFWGVTTRRRRA